MLAGSGVVVGKGNVLATRFSSAVYCMYCGVYVSLCVEWIERVLAVCFVGWIASESVSEKK